MPESLDVIGTRKALEALGGNSAKGRLIACLRIRCGKWTSMETLIDFMYGDDPSGGPDFADVCVRVYICRLRRAGWPITCANGSIGYAILREEPDATLAAEHRIPRDSRDQSRSLVHNRGNNDASNRELILALVV